MKTDRPTPSTAVSILLLLALPSFLPASHRAGQYSASALPAVVHLTAEQDPQQIMDRLHITTMRRGRDGSPDSPYAANYDESKANPFPGLSDPLVLNDGKKVNDSESLLVAAAARSRRNVRPLDLWSGPGENPNVT